MGRQDHRYDVIMSLRYRERGDIGRLVAEVIVRAEPNGRGFGVTIKSGLAELAGFAAFLFQGRRSEVAGERYLRSPRPFSAEFLVSVA